ncbi:hypothetical protein [Plantactinospora sp. WMMB782]|uniref:hypothetical protein n=1 Tax=Plantactinospora sp. WMMB782 TaxID=3404121 RepID=UPI003B950196
MMRVRSASAPVPGRPANEDHVFRYGELVGVLDGATVPDGFDTGCVHGPAWYVRRLAARLCLAAADRPAAALTGNLAAAILAVRADHGGSCDLDHPGTPSATVCLLRHGGDHVEYLVLCDSPLVLDRGGRIQVVSDERLGAAMAELRQQAGAVALVGGDVDPATRFRRAVALQRERMNRTHGYWVAAANPDAAYHAVTGSLSLRGPERLRRAALLTDGASVAVEQFGLFDWRGLLDLLSDAGPGELIRRVRLVEAGDGQRRAGFKRHDDATAVLCEFDDD